MTRGSGARALTVHPDEVDRLELRSEEVRGMLGAVPSWTIRAGQGYLLAVLVVGLLLTWLVRYPDQIEAPAVVTAREAPASIVSRSPGYLVLWVRDGQRVREGDSLGYLTNPARVQAAFALKRQLAAFQADFYGGRGFTWKGAAFEGAALGDLQEPYGDFARSVRAYRLAGGQRGYARQREGLRAQVARYRALADQTAAANELWRQELEVTGARFSMDSAVYSGRLSSRAEFLEKKQAYLAAQREYRSAAAGMANLGITVLQVEDRIRQSEQDEQKEDAELLSAVEGAMHRLDGALKAWEQAYLLRAPMDGRVAMYAYWADHQYVKQGEEVLTVVSGGGDGVLAMVDAPVERAGKIRAGQRVDLKLADYPAEEYGEVRGVVRGISLLPREKVYRITVALPAGLATSTGRRLEFRQGMVAAATIVTQDNRLLERIFFQTRRLFAR